MNELSSGLDLRIHLPGHEAHALRDYLSDAFGPEDLETKTLLMDEQGHDYALADDAPFQVATAMANRSYIPYSELPSGAVLGYKDDRIFSGSYAENATFSPILPPLQGVLTLLNLEGYDHPNIQCVVLAEDVGAPLIQQDAISATLKALGCHSVDRALLAQAWCRMRRERLVRLVSPLLASKSPTSSLLFFTQNQRVKQPDGDFPQVESPAC